MLDIQSMDDQLKKKQKELESRAKKLSDELRHVSVEISKDSEDRAQQLENEEVAEEIAEQTQRELQQVNHAILRIKQGQYTRCELCQEEIEPARLIELPYVSLFIACVS
jgi:RNA polymerase-binding transcription factor DksA